MTKLRLDFYESLSKCEILKSSQAMLILPIRKKQNFFSKEELNLILSVYGKGISSGKWKDYAIDSSIKETIFSIYKHASEMPIYRIIKIIKVEGLMKDGSIKSTSGQIIKRNKNLSYLLNYFKEKDFRLIN